MAFPWFRFYHEFATDPKILSMPEVMRLRLVMLFCVRCREGSIQFQEDELCAALGIPSPEELELTKTTFIKKGFIDKNWTVLNWDSRQYKSDSSSYRTTKWRNKKKIETSQNGHSDSFLSESVSLNSRDILGTINTTEEKLSQNGHVTVTTSRREIDASEITNFIQAWDEAGCLPPFRKTRMNIPTHEQGPMYDNMSLFTPEEISESLENYIKLKRDQATYKPWTYPTPVSFLTKGIALHLSSAKPFETFAVKHGQQQTITEEDHARRFKELYGEQHD